MRRIATAAVLALCACARHSSVANPAQVTRVDTIAIARDARELSSDAMRGRGPWTPENEAVARRLAASLARLGARPFIGDDLLVPFTTAERPRDVAYNVIGVLPARGGGTTGQLVGITAHFDHLGVGVPDASGDSIYNGFMDAALPVAMVLDVARRYSEAPGTRPLVVMFFNLEEQGLLGSKAFVASAGASRVMSNMRLLIGVDAGSPAGEAIEWQIMGGLPSHPGAQLADSLARRRGWTTHSTAPRPISDVFPFSQQGVPIIFPIPGKTWRGYSESERTDAMRRFNHYHVPADEWRAEFPMTGTAAFADWLWDIVRITASD